MQARHRFFRADEQIALTLIPCALRNKQSGVRSEADTGTAMYARTAALIRVKGVGERRDLTRTAVHIAG